MITQRLSKTLVLSTGLAIALGALGASEVLANQARGRSSTKASSASGGTTASRGGATARSSGSTATRGSRGGHRGGSRGAVSTRSGGGRRGGGRHGGRGHYGGRGYYGGHRYGISLGYYGWGGYWRYGGYFYNPFSYHYPVYYSYHPERFEDFGALDLNVRPKKTEVWIDGQYVGTAGRFDGYPGYLWLEDGPHELILFRQGKQSVVREVNVLAGNVLDIAVDMAPGDSTPAEQLTSFTQEELRRRREMAEVRGQEEQFEQAEQAERVASVERDRRSDRVRVRSDRGLDQKDVREEPGRLSLSIDPGDASIYLDGRFLGTGDELARLHSGLIVAPGDHTLEVVRPGFDSQNVLFSVQAGEETEVEITLDTG